MFPDPPGESTDALYAQLERGHPIDEIGTAELIQALSDLHREWTLSNLETRAALLLLRNRSDLQLLGVTTDRLGRDGVAIATDSGYSGLATRYTVVLSPSTGQLLGVEALLTESAGKLRVEIPAVISYQAFD